MKKGFADTLRKREAQGKNELPNEGGGVLN